MAENEVTTVKIGHLYYPREGAGGSYPDDPNRRTAFRCGPVQFTPQASGKLLADSAGRGLWYPDEIAKHFRPAPEIGSQWRAKGTSVSRSVLRATAIVITLNGGDTFEPGAFFDSFEPAPVEFKVGDRVRFVSREKLLYALGNRTATQLAPIAGWTVARIDPDLAGPLYVLRHHTFVLRDQEAKAFAVRLELELDPVQAPGVHDRFDALAFGVDWGKFYPPFTPCFPSLSPRFVPVAKLDTRARLLEAIDTYAARDDEDDFTEALDLNDVIQTTIEVYTNRPKCVAVESARTALENAIETYDALPCDEGGVVNASPVVLAVDALIEACRAAH